MAKKVFIEITPKSDLGRKRMAHHRNRWVLTRITDKPYCGAPLTTHYGLRSSDGTAFLWVLKDNDPDFHIRKF